MRQRWHKIRDQYRRAGGRVRVAWWLLVFSVVGWPATSAWVTVAHRRADPFEQLMLFLSWGALAYSSYGAVNAAEARDAAGSCDQCEHCKAQRKG